MVINKLFNKEQILLLKKAKVILMCGLPGSGKSTIAKNLSQFLKTRLCCSDKIRKEVYGINHFDPRGNKPALALRQKYYSKLYEIIKNYLAKDKKVIVDASNMDKQRLKLISRLSKLINKSQILVLVVKTPKKIICQRIKRVKKMNTANEDYFTAWQRVYGYFEVLLEKKVFFWPKASKGVAILHINNE